MHNAHAALLRLEQEICLHIYPPHAPPTCLPTPGPETNNSPDLPSYTPAAASFSHCNISNVPASNPGAEPAALTKHELPAHQAKYLVTKDKMEEFLQGILGAGRDFNVSVSQRKNRMERESSKRSVANEARPARTKTKVKKDSSKLQTKKRPLDLL